MSTEPHNKKLLLLCVIVLAIVAYFFYQENVKINERVRLEEIRLQARVDALSAVDVLAKSFSVYSLTSNEKIYGKDDELVLPIASITKIMTAIVALHAYPPETIITMSPEAIKQVGDFNLTIGQKWKIADLAKLTLISSANDGAYAMWENFPNGKDKYIEEMNARARRLGMKNTSFENITGLDVAGRATSFSTASDVNLMSAYAFLAYRDVFEVATMPEITLTSESGTTHTFKNTNTITDKIPNLLFSKTGYTDIAQGNLTIIFKNQREELLAVTLLGSTYEGRFPDMEKIVNVLYGL